MSRLVVHRATAQRSPSITGVVILGLGLGVLVGFLAGELAGPTATRALRRRRDAVPEAPGSVAALVAVAQAALDDDLALHDCRLEVLAVSPGRIELHGWVPDRRSRARAAHVVSDAVRVESLINCILVRGEDDLAFVASDTPDERTA